MEQVKGIERSSSAWKSLAAVVISRPVLTSRLCKRGKSRGGMIIRFPRRRESDSLWGCRRPKTSIAFQTPI